MNDPSANDSGNSSVNNSVNSSGNNLAAQSGGEAGELRRFVSSRAFWHTAGFLLALAIAWLVFRAYRQPDFLIDFATLQIC